MLKASARLNQLCRGWWWWQEGWQEEGVFFPDCLSSFPGKYRNYYLFEDGK